VRWALIALQLIVHAPPSLSADAGRVRDVDATRLEESLKLAGLPSPADVQATLIPDDDPDARRVPSWIVGLAIGQREIVIFPNRVLAYPYDSLEWVVRHEVAHLALDAAFGDAPLPRCLHEGVIHARAPSP
jgi:hypothetical protein